MQQLQDYSEIDLDGRSQSRRPNDISYRAEDILKQAR